MRKRMIISILVVGLLFFVGSANAQGYYFQLEQYIVHAFWNEDGTLSIDYSFYFANDPSAGYIEYVDVSLPNPNFDESSVSADTNGQALSFISRDEYQGDGEGVAVGLGDLSIPPGEKGMVHVFVGRVERVLYPDDQDSEYASAVLAPARFQSDITYGKTDMTVTFHLPPGVQPDEPRWHTAPSGFPDTPETGFDGNGRITYTWHNPLADGQTKYDFGASFPSKYVPDSAIVRPNPFAWVGSLAEYSIPLGCISAFVLIAIAGVVGGQRRKLQYLPPKIAIEGHGIKRGLTAVEAAILLEQPIDKLLTMILFSAVKKGAAQVTSRDPLRLEVTEPVPEDLQPYEKEFVQAFKAEDNRTRQRELQDMVVALIRSVSQKMKGFSRRESVAYYRSIVNTAWGQVEAANTPEVKSQKFDENLEWTMLDRDFDGRTREVFRTGPVFVPVWWPRYDPGFGRSVTSGAPVSTGRASTGGGQALPGSTFAASVVGGIQTFSSRVVGNITDFTGRVTQVTNPPPKPSTSYSSRSGGGGGGHSCACACACAGCACACAGGGR